MELLSNFWTHNPFSRSLHQETCWIRTSLWINVPWIDLWMNMFWTTTFFASSLSLIVFCRYASLRSTLFIGIITSIVARSFFSTKVASVSLSMTSFSISSTGSTRTAFDFFSLIFSAWAETFSLALSASGAAKGSYVAAATSSLWPATSPGDLQASLAWSSFPSAILFPAVSRAAALLSSARRTS